MGLPDLVLARQLENWQSEVARVGAEEASSADVPGNGSRDDTESATSRLNSSDGGELGNEEEQEGEVQEDLKKGQESALLSATNFEKHTQQQLTEEEDQAEGASERGDEQDEGEDEPSGKVETNSLGHHVRSSRSITLCGGLESIGNTEPRNEQDGVRPPEGAVRAECSGTEAVIEDISKRFVAFCANIRLQRTHVLPAANSQTPATNCARPP